MSITPNDQIYTIVQVKEFNSYSTFGHHGLIKRGTLEIKQSTRAIPPKIIFFIKKNGKISLGFKSISKNEIIDFAKKYDPQYFHTNEDKAKESQFNGLIASGWQNKSTN